MKSFISIVAIVFATCVLFADEPRTGLDPNAKGMIGRVGDKVMRIGTIQAGPEHTANTALMSVPPDDSSKFHGHILVSDNPVFKPACDRLLNDLTVMQQFAAWFKMDDVAKSWLVPQVRKWEDVAQKHWFDGLRPVLFPLDENGRAIALKDAQGNTVAPFPSIVIKPPLNGRYGDNAEVVTVVYGYSGNVEETCERIQTAIDQWIQKHEAKGLIQASGGPSVELGRSQDWLMPFAATVPMPPVAPDFDPAAQSQWPAKRFSQPKPLSARQIKELTPGAPQDFRLSLLENDVSDPNQVRSAWLEYQTAELAKQRNSMLQEHERIRRELQAQNSDRADHAETVIDPATFNEAKPDAENPQAPASVPAKPSSEVAGLVWTIALPVLLVVLAQKGPELVRAIRQTGSTSSLKS